MARWYSTLLVLPVLLATILYCDATPANTSNMGVLPVIVSRSSSATTSAPTSESSSVATNTTQNSGSDSARMQLIKTLYGFQGFVYDIDSCPSKEDFQNDFKEMKTLGTEVVITFGVCGGKETDSSYYEDLINVANDAEIYIIPLVWTLSTKGQSFQDYAVPIMNAVIQAVKANPNPVIAVALGDEPLYDNDAGSASALAKYIDQMREEFTSAGLDIPISISDMAYGWKQAGDISSMVEAVDFFMINNFPYFAGNAQTGGSDQAWDDFTGDVKYFQGIANGKPLLVTQTGWPDNTEEFGPQKATSDLTNLEAYWNLLNGHCQDYFQKNNIGWMWRSYGDNIVGWGIVDSNNKLKFNANVTKC